MSQVVIFIIGVMVGAGIAWVITKVIFNGENKWYDFMQKQAREKEENKQKIMELFEGKDKIVNDDGQRLLGVSDSTIQRYLNELQTEGKIKQFGETGKVYYTKT